MSDKPDYIVIAPNPADVPLSWPGFPHRLAMLPEGVTIEQVRSKPTAVGVFLIEAGCVGDVLNGTALPAYLAQKVAVLVHARRARDLRPLLRRASIFQARGYAVEVLSC